MTSKRQNITPVRSVAFELGPSFFHAVICEGTVGGQDSARTVSVQWRHEAITIHSAIGLTELSIALIEFVKRENLQGLLFNVVLDGEYCITRYVSGTEETVNKTLDDLEVRSHRYLLLGQGSKIAARHVEISDDDQCWGMLTVANQRTIETLSAAVAAAGVELASVGASVVVLAGLVHRLFRGDSAGLLIRPREGGADVAVVDQGRLLLDVRPAQKMDGTDLSEYISDRLALLERFFGRNASSDNGELHRIFVFGNNDTTDPITREFSCCGLMVDAIDRRVADLTYIASDAEDLFQYSGALGASFGLLNGAGSIPYPNLLDVVKQTGRETMARHLIKTLWPLAAAAVLCIGLLSLREVEERRLNSYSKAIVEFEDHEIKLWSLQDEVYTLQQEAQHLTTINRQLDAPDYDHLITIIAGCLSNDSHLESISVDQGSALRMHGSCGSEEDVYQFVENIKRLPVFSSATLSGTQSASSATNPHIEFDVHAQLRPLSVAAASEVPRA